IILCPFISREELMTASVVVALLTSAVIQAPSVAVEASRLAGAYRWESGGVVDILLWEELGPGRLVAFDDRGSVRALTPIGPRAFTVGKTIAIPEPAAARVHFEPADASTPAQSLL